MGPMPRDTFSQAVYTLQATITNADGLTTTSSVVVTVSQTPTAFVVVPSVVILNINSTQQFTGLCHGPVRPANCRRDFTHVEHFTQHGCGHDFSNREFYTAPAAQATATITAQSGASSVILQFRSTISCLDQCRRRLLDDHRQLADQYDRQRLLGWPPTSVPSAQRPRPPSPWTAPAPSETCSSVTQTTASAGRSIPAAAAL